LHILVNGAAGNFLATAEGMRLKGFKTVMEIDTMGTFNLSSAAFPALRDSGRGVIINISATLHYGATWYQAHASAAKAAIDSLTRSLGLEWGAFNIRVCGIAPGPIAGTPGMTKLAPGDDAKVVEDAVKEVIPLGRMGTTADIAYMATFLCSDAASFVTGETVVVDGGHWLWKEPMLPREMVEEVSRGVEQKSRGIGGAALDQKSKL
jgi:peroxisomal 2,4-dienoyl-CoA reductase